MSKVLQALPLAFASLPLFLSGFTLAQSSPASPQATIYISQNWCGGGYCNTGPSATFQSSLEQALLTSGLIQAVRRDPADGLVLNSGITSIGGGGGICLPLIGCLNAKTVRASIELTEKSNGAILWRDTCEGTANGFSGWSKWTGYLTVNSDDKAADCAGKLVHKFLASPVFLGYLTRSRAPLVGSAPAQSTGAAGTGTSTGGTPGLAPVVATASQS